MPLVSTFLGSIGPIMTDGADPDGTSHTESPRQDLHCCFRF